MSGHSKWHNIQNRKGKVDAQRSNIFTKLGREISVAVKEGGPDPSSNTRLRLAIQKAKENNMPNDTITKAIKKANGELGSVNYENITYEGYGIGGSAVIVECLTDNKNRTAGDVRHAFDKFGGSLGTSGSVSYLFKKKGQIIIEKTDAVNGDDLFLIAVDAGAEDVVESDDCFEILIPDMYVNLNEQQAQTFEKMFDMLDGLDDVQEIYHNVEE